ncbi:MAG: sodium:proline symporter, partial [Clostridiales bacterium]|nr:sodium:proline symporter [Clostridiales bacterium]
GAMIFIWKFVVRVAFAGSVLDIYELLPAFILNLVVAVIVSLITKAPAKELVDTFEQVKAEE